MDSVYCVQRQVQEFGSWVPVVLFMEFLRFGQAEVWGLKSANKLEVSCDQSAAGNMSLFCRGVLLSSSRRHLSCDDCLEDVGRLLELFCIVLFITIVHSDKCTHTHIHRCTRACWFRFSFGFLVIFVFFSYLGPVCLFFRPVLVLFCVFCLFSSLVVSPSANGCLETLAFEINYNLSQWM